ncbi:MAG: flagellar basal body P-ring formation chaperone FlgA [Bacillota bacterium]
MFNKKFYQIILIILLFIVFVSPSVFSAKVISIDSEVSANGEWIKLGDIAEISGFSDNVKNELKEINLEKAPRPSYEKRITKQLVKLILKDKDYEVKEIEFNMPEQIKVKALSQKISESEIENFVKKYVKDKIDYDYEKIEIDISSLSSEIIIPASDYSLAVNREKNNYRGNYSLPVDIMINGDSYKRLYVNLRTSIYRKAFEAKKTMYKGNKISKNDFELKTKDITKIDAPLIDDWDNSLVKDGKLTKTISNGEVLTAEYLEKPIIIKYGDEVQAEVIIGGIKVTAMVKAKERGKKGDKIKVENINSEKEFKAEIINNRLVRLVRN